MTKGTNLGLHGQEEHGSQYDMSGDNRENYVFDVCGMLERNRSKSCRILFRQDLYRSCRNMHFCRNILERNRNEFFGGNTVDKH